MIRREKVKDKKLQVIRTFFQCNMYSRAGFQVLQHRDPK